MTARPHRRRTRSLLVVGLVVLPLLLAACGSDGSAPGEASAAVARTEGRTVIDVRTPDEYDEAHIEGARRIGLADDDFAEQVAALDPDGAYVVYCRTGQRSAQAAAAMREAGLDVLDGGAMSAMVDAGWPLAAA